MGWERDWPAAVALSPLDSWQMVHSHATSFFGTINWSPQIWHRAVRDGEQFVPFWEVDSACNSDNFLKDSRTFKMFQPNFPSGAMSLSLCLASCVLVHSDVVDASCRGKFFLFRNFGLQPREQKKQTSSHSDLLVFDIEFSLAAGIPTEEWFFLEGAPTNRKKNFYRSDKTFDHCVWNEVL